MSRDALLLDLDGTLVDTHALILSSWRHVRDRFALDVDDDRFRQGMGRPLLEVLGAFATSTAHAEEMVVVYREHNAGVHDQMIRVFDGVPEALRTLRARGIKLAVVTSKSRPFAERGLRVTGLVVDALVTPSDVTRPKPDAEPVTLALSLLGVARERAVMVGDSPHDLLAGRAAGVATAAVSWGAFSLAELLPCTPDHVLHHPSELVSLADG